MSNNIMEAVAIMADEAKKWRVRAEDFQARWLDADQKLGEADVKIEELTDEMNETSRVMTEATEAINTLIGDRKDRDKIIVELTDYIENAKKLNQANRDRMGAEPHESATEALIRVLGERDALFKENEKWRRANEGLADGVEARESEINMLRLRISELEGVAKDYENVEVNLTRKLRASYNTVERLSGDYSINARKLTEERDRWRAEAERWRSIAGKGEA